VSIQKLSEATGVSLRLTAKIDGTTGSPTIDTSSRPGYTVYTFTGDGSITVGGIGGLAEVFVVGGGGGGRRRSDQSPVNRAGGGAGGVKLGNFYLSNDTYAITIGAGGSGGATTATDGSPSTFGNEIKCGGGQVGLAGTGGALRSGIGGGGSSGGISISSGVGQTNNGGGSGGVLYGSNQYDGIDLSITGSSVTYAAGGLGAGANSGGANTGTGGDAGSGGGFAGGSGVVIIAVKN